MPESKKKPHALSSKRRLHYAWEYRRFFDRSDVFRLRECVIFRVQNDLGHFRLGITLKARGSSVERNRVKRVIREAFRTQSDLLGSYDYNVVIPSTKKLSHPFPERLGERLRKDLRDAIKTNKVHD